MTEAPGTSQDPIATIDGAIDASLSGTRVVRGVYSLLKVVRRNYQLEDHARRLLGLDPPPSSSAGYRSDSVHPLYAGSGTIHPDNEDSLLLLAKPRLQQALEQELLFAADEVHISLGGDILLFGSPASEGLSRVVFGYSLHTQGAYLPSAHEPFTMAYRWELSDLKGQPVRRYVRGLDDAPLRPPWAIRNLQGGGRLPLYRPEPIRDEPLRGFLKDDYLLVTKVPNFLTDEYVDGSSIISFGGAHGTATRAVKLLLRSRSTLRAIANALPLREGRLPASYQVLLYISSIKHDPVHGSTPLDIGFIDAVELDPRERYQTWDDAQRIAAPQLAQWLRQTSP